MSKMYHDRVFHGKLENVKSISKTANRNYNQFIKEKKGPSFKFLQGARKGLQAEDVSRKHDYGHSKNYSVLPFDFAHTIGDKDKEKEVNEMMKSYSVQKFMTKEELDVESQF